MVCSIPSRAHSHFARWMSLPTDLERFAFAQIVFPLGAIECLTSLRSAMFLRGRVECEAFEHLQIDQFSNLQQLPHVFVSLALYEFLNAIK